MTVEVNMFNEEKLPETHKDYQAAGKHERKLSSEQEETLRRSLNVMCLGELPVSNVDFKEQVSQAKAERYASSF